uniref:Uncharacterized protein n=1 Tax=Arundo donax TaxID=35708 RepID=A0A0A9EDR3_ARUDO
MERGGQAVKVRIGSI